MISPSESVRLAAAKTRTVERAAASAIPSNNDSLLSHAPGVVTWKIAIELPDDSGAEGAPEGENRSIGAKAVRNAQVVVLLLHREKIEARFLGGEPHRDARIRPTARDRLRDRAVVGGDVPEPFRGTASAEESIETPPRARALLPSHPANARSRESRRRAHPDRRRKRDTLLPPREVQKSVARSERRRDDGRVPVSPSLREPVNARPVHQAPRKQRQRIAAASGERDDPNPVDPPELECEKPYRGIAPRDHHGVLVVVPGFRIEGVRIVRPVMGSDPESGGLDGKEKPSGADSRLPEPPRLRPGRGGPGGAPCAGKREQLLDRPAERPRKRERGRDRR